MPPILLDTAGLNGSLGAAAATPTSSATARQRLLQSQLLQSQELDGLWGNTAEDEAAALEDIDEADTATGPAAARVRGWQPTDELLGDEGFMQHVTRVHKVTKKIWDFYTLLTAQQAHRAHEAAAAAAEAKAVQAPRQRQDLTATSINVDRSSYSRQPSESLPSPWDDESSLRFRSTFEDLPQLLPDQQSPLSTAAAAMPGAQSTAGRTAGAPLDQQQQQQRWQPDRLTSSWQPKGPAAAGQATELAQHSSPAAQQQQQQQQQQAVAAPGGVYRLRLRRSIFGLPVLSPQHRLAWLWSLLMLGLDMTYIAFVMPLFVSFCPVVLGGINWCSSIDLAAGLAYMANLVLSFQIGFVLEFNYKKRVLLDGPHVARFYVMHSSFVVDAMAVLPVVYQIIMVSANIQNYWANRCLTFTMLLRLLRLAQLMRMLFVDSLIASGTTGLSRYVSVLGMYALIALYAVSVLVHNLACLAWLVALMEEPQHSWAATVKWAEGGEGGLVDAAPPEQYLAALYWVLTTVTGTGYGDIVPTRPLEVVLAMIFMLTGVSMVALLVGSMTELMTQATSDARRAAAVRQKMTEVDDWLLRRGIPGKLSRAVVNYYNQGWLPHRDHPTEAAILSELPPYLRGRVAGAITAELFRGIPVLAGLPGGVRDSLASRLVPVEVAPGHELCREGDIADCIWLLQEGELLRIRATTEIELLGPPCLLGESCLLASQYPELHCRPATLRAVTSCQLWQVSLRELQMLMVNYTGFAAQLMEAARASVMQKVSQLPLWRSADQERANDNAGGGAAASAGFSGAYSEGGGAVANNVGNEEYSFRVGGGAASRRQLSARSVPVMAAAAGSGGGRGAMLAGRSTSGGVFSGLPPASAAAAAAAGVHTAAAAQGGSSTGHPFFGGTGRSLAARSVPALSRRSGSHGLSRPSQTSGAAAAAMAAAAAAAAAAATTAAAAGRPPPGPRSGNGSSSSRRLQLQPAPAAFGLELASDITVATAAGMAAAAVGVNTAAAHSGLALASPPLATVFSSDHQHFTPPQFGSSGGGGGDGGSSDGGSSGRSSLELAAAIASIAAPAAIAMTHDPAAALEQQHHWQQQQPFGEADAGGAASGGGSDGAAGPAAGGGLGPRSGGGLHAT